MDLDPNDILSASELCRILRITRPTLYSWVKTGKLRPWKRLGEGSSYLFLRSDLASRPPRKYSRDQAGPAEFRRVSRESTSAGVLLISEDESAVGLVLSELKRQSYRVSVVRNSSHFSRALREERPEAVILDLDRRDGSGWELFAKVRGHIKSSALSIPAPLIISGKYTRPEDTVRALREGASDFLKKPFASSVLTARIRRLLRSRLWSELDAQGPHNVLTSRDGALSVDRELQTLHLGDPSRGGEVTITRLTRKEADLLCLFLKRPGRIFTKPMLLEVVWGYVSDIRSRTLDCHVMNLRKKLGPQRDRIETYYGLGYRFMDVLPTAV